MTGPLSRARDEAEAFLKLQEAATGESWSVFEFFVPSDWTDSDSPKVKAAIVDGPSYLPDPETPYWQAVDAALIAHARNTALPRLTLELAAECERLRSERSAYRRLAAKLLKQARGLRDWEALPCADREALALQEPSR